MATGSCFFSEPISFNLPITTYDPILGLVLLKCKHFKTSLVEHGRNKTYIYFAENETAEWFQIILINKILLTPTKTFLIESTLFAGDIDPVGYH